MQLRSMFSAPLRSAQSQGPPDLVDPLRPERSFLRFNKKTGTSEFLQMLRRPCQESMRQDLNLRPLRPERSALPN